MYKIIFKIKNLLYLPFENILFYLFVKNPKFKEDIISI